MQKTQSHIFLFSYISLLCYYLQNDASCYFKKYYYIVTFQLHCLMWTILSNLLVVRNETKYVLKIWSLPSSLEVPISFCHHIFFVISTIFSKIFNPFLFFKNKITCDYFYFKWNRENSFYDQDFILLHITVYIERILFLINEGPTLKDVDNYH
jgi:hypothetical protein